MTRRNTRQVIVSVGILGCAVLLWAVMRPAPPEPMYDGKTVTQWLCSPDYLTARRRVDWAILSMGKECVPTLRRHLREGVKMGAGLFPEGAPMVAVALAASSVSLRY